jgi:hypothetical protein
VILQTAYLDESSRAPAQVAGADEYIGDSGDIRVLLNAVDRLITPNTA